VPKVIVLFAKGCILTSGTLMADIAMVHYVIHTIHVHPLAVTAVLLLVPSNTFIWLLYALSLINMCSIFNYSAVGNVWATNLWANWTTVCPCDAADHESCCS